MMLCGTGSVWSQSAKVCENPDFKASVVQSITESNPGQEVNDLTDAELVTRNGHQNLTCRYTVKFASGSSAKVLGIASVTSDGDVDLNTKFENK
jgi:hypothetical protein